MSELENKRAFKPDILFWIFSLCLIGILLVAVMAYFVKARSTSSVNACVNNLLQIDSAANQFALEHKLTNGSPINFPNDLTPYLKLRDGKIPSCPNGGTYHISQVCETPTCSLGITVSPAHVLP